VQVHAEVAKERDGVGDGQAAQHATHDRSSPSPEIRVGDARVRDVAACAAADENFRAEPPCAVQQDDRCRRMESS
jgi:hypothetical protein